MEMNVFSLSHSLKGSKALKVFVPMKCSLQREVSSDYMAPSAGDTAALLLCVT